MKDYEKSKLFSSEAIVSVITRMLVCWCQGGWDQIEKDFIETIQNLRCILKTSSCEEYLQ